MLTLQNKIRMSTALGGLEYEIERKVMLLSGIILNTSHASRVIFRLALVGVDRAVGPSLDNGKMGLANVRFQQGSLYSRQSPNTQ